MASSVVIATQLFQIPEMANLGGHIGFHPAFLGTDKRHMRLKDLWLKKQIKPDTSGHRQWLVLTRIKSYFRSRTRQELRS